MDKRTKLQKILTNLSDKESGVTESFKIVEREMKGILSKIHDDAELKTIGEAKRQIASIKLRLQESLDALAQTLADLKQHSVEKEKELTQKFNTKLDLLRNAVSEARMSQDEQGSQVSNLQTTISSLKNDIAEIFKSKKDLPNLLKEISDIELNLGKEVFNLREETDLHSEKITAYKNTFEEFTKDIRDIRNRLSNNIHGGNANRNIMVGSNSSTLSRYTDINLKAGSNVTLTYTNNDNLKTTDLTIAATGSGGTSRSISTVSVSSIVAAPASTDIVLIANQGILLTMPTAVGNTNLYTIKNTSTSSIMILANGSETIDGSANVILPVQYTSVDLISDNANFQIT